MNREQRAAQLAEFFLDLFEQLDRVESKIDALLTQPPRTTPVEDVEDGGRETSSESEAPASASETPTPPRTKERNISDMRYYSIACGVLKSLLADGAPSIGKLTTQLIQELSEQRTSFLLAMSKLCSTESFVVMPETGRGQARFIRLKDPEAARAWLREVEGRNFETGS